MYRCLNGAAPRYLTELATPVGSSARRRLRSASSTDFVSATRRSTIGDRTFAVAGPRARNSLPPAVRSSATYNIFKKDLKYHLFGLSFSLWRTLTMYSALAVVYTAYCALQIVRLTLHYITSSPLKRSGIDHTVVTLQTDHTCLNLESVHQTAPPLSSDSSHLIAAYYSLIDPRRMKGWVGLVSWPTADGLPT